MIKLPTLEELSTLKSTPGIMLISESGRELYFSHPSGIYMLTGPDFHSMTPEQVNAYLQVALSK